MPHASQTLRCIFHTAKWWDVAAALLLLETSISNIIMKTVWTPLPPATTHICIWHANKRTKRWRQCLQDTKWYSYIRSLLLLSRSPVLTLCSFFRSIAFSHSALEVQKSAVAIYDTSLKIHRVKSSIEKKTFKFDTFGIPVNRRHLR